MVTILSPAERGTLLTRVVVGACAVVWVDLQQITLGPRRGGASPPAGRFCSRSG
jgi:hypothetical protein